MIMISKLIEKQETNKLYLLFAAALNGAFCRVDFLDSEKSPKIEIYYFYSEKASRFSTLTTLYKRII